MTEPTKVMTDAAGGHTYEQYIAQGWNDHQLVAQGLMEPRATTTSPTDERLLVLIERVERLEEEKKGVADDIKDVWAEAKAVGYDTKIAKEIIKLHKMKPDDRHEREQLIETCKAATGMG